MKEILLTKGKVAIVDDEEFDYLNQWKWYYSSTGYACRKPNEIIYMHREIMKNPKGLEVDHINKNRLDNQKENLRAISKLNNMLNTGKRSHNTTGYKGVRIKKDYPRKKPYYATITVNKKVIRLGHYATPEEAAIEYNTYAYIYHGEFANLNQINPD